MNEEQQREILETSGMRQAHEFLGAEEAGTAYTNDAQLNEIRKHAEGYFRQLAEVAALSQHPAYNLIVDEIKRMRDEELSEIDTLILQNKLEDNVMRQKIYCAARLKTIIDWLVAQPEKYRDEVAKRHQREDTLSGERVPQA